MLKKTKRPWQTSSNKNSSSGWTNEGNSFYHTKEWRRLRAAQLQKEPCCQYCKKQNIIGVQATTVDHLRPSRLYPELEKDPNNLVSSCKHHHYSKTSKFKVYNKQAFEEIIIKEGWDKL